MCNHDYTDNNNTLIGIPKMKMVTPMKYYLQCKECGKIFTINASEIKDKKGFLCKFFK